MLISGDASAGIALQCASELSALRSHVRFVSGNEVAVLRELALLEAGDVIGRWIYDVMTVGWSTPSSRCNARMRHIAISDSLLSPIAVPAAAAFAVVAGGAGPFDSHVGTLALCNALVTACAGRLRASATSRLDRFEAMWHEAKALREQVSSIDETTG